MLAARLVSFATYIPFFLIKYMGSLIIMSNEINGAILAF